MAVLSRKGRVKRFGGDRRGSAAVEFAIVAPVFLTFMFALFEIGWFFFANSIVDAAVADAGRLIRTGQIQQMGGTDEYKAEYLRDRVCNTVSIFGDCDTRLTVEVKNYATFDDLAADTSATVCADASETEVDGIPFNPGGESVITRVRICFLHTVVNPALGMNLADTGTNQRKLVATVVSKTEPYEKNTQT